MARTPQVELWRGNKISVAEELPELEEEETDIHEASQRLKETKQRMYERRKGGGKGEKGKGEREGKGRGTLAKLAAMPLVPCVLNI